MKHAFGSALLIFFVQSAAGEESVKKDSGIALLTVSEAVRAYTQMFPKYDAKFRVVEEIGPVALKEMADTVSLSISNPESITLKTEDGVQKPLSEYPPEFVEKYIWNLNGKVAKPIKESIFRIKRNASAYRVEIFSATDKINPRKVVSDDGKVNITLSPEHHQAILAPSKYKYPDGVVDWLAEVAQVYEKDIAIMLSGWPASSTKIKGDIAVISSEKTVVIPLIGGTCKLMLEVVVRLSDLLPTEISVFHHWPGEKDRRLAYRYTCNYIEVSDGAPVPKEIIKENFSRYKKSDDYVLASKTRIEINAISTTDVDSGNDMLPEIPSGFAVADRFTGETFATGDSLKDVDEILEGRKGKSHQNP